MSVVSRKEVFGDAEVSADAGHEYTFDPGIEFEIVDVADVAPEPQPETIETFPLFSGVADVQVSLEEKEYVYELGKENTERPRSYYCAQYSSQEKAKFQQVAVDGQEIISQSRNIIPSKYKLVVLDRQQDTQRPATTTKKTKRTRPGKKQRLGRIEAAKRRKEFRHRLLQIQRQNRIKKTRRGGKRAKKNSRQPAGIDLAI